MTTHPITALDDALGLFGTLDRIVGARQAVFAAPTITALAVAIVDLGAVVAELDGDLARVAAHLVTTQGQSEQVHRALLELALAPEDLAAAKAAEAALADGEAHDRALIDTGVALAVQCFGAAIRSEARATDLKGIPDLLGRLERWLEIIRCTGDLEELAQSLASQTPHRRRSR